MSRASKLINSLVENKRITASKLSKIRNKRYTEYADRDLESTVSLISDTLETTSAKEIDTHYNVKLAKLRKILIKKRDQYMIDYSKAIDYPKITFELGYEILTKK